MKKSDNGQWSVAEVFRIGFEQYVADFGPLPSEQFTIAHAIINCRTEVLGGHEYHCEECANSLTLYNSCRNRHCPQCQSLARIQWVEARMNELLNVPYFHAVFTIPEQLRTITLRNRVVMYRILFRAVKETLQQLADNPKRLGAKIGFIAVLHTWTQRLMYHPHIHVIIPGGGIVKDHSRWIACAERFLFPVAVVQKLFRGKVMDYFKEAVRTNEITFCGLTHPYAQQQSYSKLLEKLYHTKWHVYMKPPFTSAHKVVKYLGGYTHRIAIANKRIVRIADGKVTFLYKDRKKKRTYTETITCVEFIRRFLLHCVPPYFMRIRHYGFLSSKCKKLLLPVCRKLLGQTDVTSKKMAWFELIEKLCGTNPRVCPFCKKGIIKPIRKIAPVFRNRVSGTGGND